MVNTLVRPHQRTDGMPSGTSHRARIWTLTVACTGVSLVVASMVALNTALGDLAVATSATQSQLTWVVDGYTVALACLLLPAGAIGDRYGRRGALLFGLTVFSVASVAPAIFDTPLQIIVARAVAGTGAAFVMPATLSLLTVAYPKEERMKAVGIWAGVAGSGGVLGMFGSGILLSFWDWKSIFWALGAAGALVFALTCSVASSREPDAPRVDWLGAVLIGAAVAVSVFGILQAPQRGWGDAVVVGGLVVGAVLAGAFGVVEFRRRQPLLDVRLFADPGFATGVGTIVMLFGATFGFFYLGMQYVQQIMGYSALMTAVAFGPFMVPLGILSALSFWYVPKLGLRLVLLVGMLVMSVGFLCMRGLSVDSSYFDLAWPALILSAGIGLCTAPTTSAIMAAVPDEKQGVASAVNDTTREVGGALGIAVAGSILAGRRAQELATSLSAFPPAVRGAATDSLAQAVEVANRLGPQGKQLADVSKAAFLTAMHASTLVMAVIVAIAAVLIGLWAPGRDGRQLGPIRRVVAPAPATAGRHRA
ncbi:MFS transporter [Mycobacterium persicum]|uniref:MFS transporter n=1 Tax=Mycobacterium persicum TaxID=1487726 RepID=A0A8E2ISI7_9MYCO|nr:MFS transporter [Mycobacterium persicum]KZS84053.1 MFS transporter [Mycobacterium persicum]ORB94623.1 MFS transporter [Mycobacterium persicum]ORC08380.1 MFS transporter [Mycobacterium persicum]VAZ72028.1 Multidrug resistance protein Stp [Mycobacterium persicum]VAZ88529.1 Multidrug resistance protein Stp [Mycobacterium persicum]